MYIMVPMRASRLPRSALSSTCGLRSDYLTQTHRGTLYFAGNEASNEFSIWHRRIGPVSSIMVIVGWVLGDFFAVAWKCLWS